MIKIMMKKILVILVIAAIITACNNSNEQKTLTTDTLNASESPLMDAVNTADSASKIMHDSTGMMLDTMIKK